MKRSFFLMLLGMLLLAPPLHAYSAGKTTETDSELQALLAELDVRWNGRNADSMSLLFTPDVDFRIWGTRHHRSREEFRSHYEQAFSKISPNVRHTTTLDTVRLLGPGLALLDGEVVVGESGAPEEEMRRYYYSAVATKRDGVWLFDAFRVARQTSPSQ